MKGKDIAIITAILGAGYLASKALGAKPAQATGGGMLYPGNYPSESLFNFIPENGLQSLFNQAQPSERIIGPVGGSPLSSQAAAALQAGNWERFTIYSTPEQEEAMILQTLARNFGGLAQIPTEMFPGGVVNKVALGAGTPAEVKAATIMLATPPGETVGVWGFTGGGGSYRKGGEPKAGWVEAILGGTLERTRVISPWYNPAGPDPDAPGMPGTKYAGYTYEPGVGTPVSPSTDAGYAPSAQPSGLSLAEHGTYYPGF